MPINPLFGLKEHMDIGGKVAGNRRRQSDAQVHKRAAPQFHRHPLLR